MPEGPPDPGGTLVGYRRLLARAGGAARPPFTRPPPPWAQRVRKNVVPSPGVLSIQMRPP